MINNNFNAITKNILVCLLLGLVTINSVYAQQLTCLSGQVPSGDQCAAGIPQQCESSVLAPQSLSTAHPVSLLEGAAANNGQLALTVRHGFTTGRRITSLRLSSKDACNYPSTAEHWSKSVDEQACVDTYTSSIPWPVAYNASAGAAAQNEFGCGLVRTEDDDYVIFDGAVVVTISEPLPDQRGASLTRSIESTLRFRIKFPKRVSASAGVVIFADARVLSAITEQEWIPDQNAANVALTTSLQWPFRVDSVEYETLPSGLSTVDSGNQMTPLSDCEPNNGGACGQLWAQLVRPDSETCRLDGQYVARLRLACHSSVAPEDCPLDESNRFATVSFSLQSDDLCAIVEDVVGVSADLSSHESFEAGTFTFGLPKAAFFQDQPMHFKMTADSDDGFALEATIIESVEITQQSGSSIVVYDASSGAPAAAWAYSSAFDSAGATALTHQHYFTLTPTPSLFGEVAEDGSDVSTITCVLRVVFADTTPLGRRKREVRQVMQMSADGEAVQADAQFRVSPAQLVGSDRGDIEFDIVDTSAGATISVSHMLPAALVALVSFVFMGAIH